METGGLWIAIAGGRLPLFERSETKFSVHDLRCRNVGGLKFDEGSKHYSQQGSREQDLCLP